MLKVKWKKAKLKKKKKEKSPPQIPKHISSLFNAHDSQNHVSDYTDVPRFPFSSDKLEVIDPSYSALENPSMKKRYNRTYWKNSVFNMGLLFLWL